MDTVTLDEAKDRLGELVERARHGETTQIVVEGRSVAQISAVPTTRKPVDVDALAKLTAGMTGPALDTDDWNRTFRDEGRC